MSALFGFELVLLQRTLRGCKGLFINTLDSFAIPIDGEHVKWGV